MIQLSYQCDAPTVFDIGEDFGIDNIIQSIRDASTDEQREILFSNTTSSPYFFLSFEQVDEIFFIVCFVARNSVNTFFVGSIALRRNART